MAVVREFTEPGWSWDGAEIPDHQPAFRSFVPALSGEIWVLRHGPSVRLDDCVEAPLAAGAEEARANPCWEDDWILDAFGPDGRYLGEVEVPEELAPFELYMVVRGDMVVAVTMVDAGVMRVRRYLIVLPGGP